MSDSSCDIVGQPDRSNLQINDMLKDPKVLKIINQHRDDLEAAGVQFITLRGQKFREDQLTIIEPYGGQTQAANDALHEIGKDLKAAGLGDFNASVIQRCGAAEQLIKRVPQNSR